MPPLPLDKWTGIKDARVDMPTCIQGNPMANTTFANSNISAIGVEDCLYLAVYTNNVTRRSPVLVHFHGGAFSMGGASWCKADNLMDEDIVVVNANYRVGIFGFLSFENSDLPGNQGMKDQVMVLKWVKENIASFGGDPLKVTIIGESAGGASVYHHIVSPMSRGLFHRAISESGTSYALWALAPPGLAKSRAEKLMEKIGCPKNSKEAIPCLMEKNATEIAGVFHEFVEFHLDPLVTFGPCLEANRTDAFLVDPISKWEHNPVPLIIGMTSAEGLFRTASYLLFKTDFKWLSDNFDRLAPVSLMYFASASDPAEITRKVRKYYFPKHEISMSHWVNLTNMYSDCWFTTAVIDGANKHKGDVYFYYYDYRASLPTIYGQLPKDLIIGADHVAESYLLWNFTLPFLPAFNLTAEDTKMSKLLVKTVADFMNYGRPTPKDSEWTWPKWTPESNFYIQIDNKGIHPKKGLLEERYKFWNSIQFRDNYEKTIQSAAPS